MPSSGTMLSSVLLNIANFIILFLIVRSLVYKPVKKFMSAREERINEALESAGEKLAAAEREEADVKAKFASIEDDLAAQRQAILDKAEANAACIVRNAKDDAAKTLERAKNQSAVLAAQTMKEMHGKMADMAVDLAQQILEREISKSDNSELIDNYFDRMGQK
jgi:F-type H+-transporting ATPase subunit b